MAIPSSALGALLGTFVSLIPLKQLVADYFIGASAGILSRETVGATIPLLGNTLYNERSTSSSSSACLTTDDRLDHQADRHAHGVQTWPSWYS